MQVELFKPDEMNETFWQAFREMRDADPRYDDPFFDPEFARMIGNLREDTRIAVAFGAGLTGPVAFWPLHVRSGGWARPIGGPFSDWHGPIVQLGLGVDPADMLKGAGLSGFTSFGMPGHLSAGHIETRVGANMTDLSMGFDAFLESQRQKYPKHFKKIRRMQRNMDRDFADITYHIDDQSTEAFDWVMERKRQQYVRTGKHDVLGPDWAQTLMMRLRRHSSERLRARLSTLRFDGRIAAAEFNLQSDTVLHGWITAFDTEFHYYSPGYMLQHEILRRMPDLGLTTYDAGPGLDYYKKYYCNYQLAVDEGALRAAEGARVMPRVLPGTWRAAEAILPGAAARLMGKVRRRTDQIMLAETTLGGRARGFAAALKPTAK